MKSSWDSVILRAGQESFLGFLSYQLKYKSQWLQARNPKPPSLWPPGCTFVIQPS